MRKALLIVCMIMIIFLGGKKTDDLIIPTDAIRVRVIANSNSIFDQAVKMVVKDNLQTVTNDLLKDVDTVDGARFVIKKNISLINDKIEEVLKSNDYNVSFSVNYGFNLFPYKKFKGVTYEEGYYESLVVTLGSGNGDNWWCVLFPPLCLVEDSNVDTSEVEYKSYIKLLIDKYFGN